MPFSQVATVKTYLGSTPLTTSSIDTTGASVIVVCIAEYALNTFTVTDSKGNTYTLIARSGVPTSSRTAMFRCENPIVGTGHTFTFTTSGSPFSSAVVFAFSGSDTTSSYDTQSTATSASASSLATGSVTPGRNGSLLVSMVCIPNNTSNYSIDNSFSTPENLPVTSNFGISAAYKEQTTAAAINPTWSRTGTTDMVVAIAAFKPPAAAGAKTLAALGVG